MEWLDRVMVCFLSFFFSNRGGRGAGRLKWDVGAGAGGGKSDHYHIV